MKGPFHTASDRVCAADGSVIAIALAHGNKSAADMAVEICLQLNSALVHDIKAEQGWRTTPPRRNNAVRSLSLATSTGADLDYLGERWFGMGRVRGIDPKESDDAYRKRLQERHRNRMNAAPQAAYATIIGPLKQEGEFLTGVARIDNYEPGQDAISFPCSTRPIFPDDAEGRN